MLRKELIRTREQLLQHKKGPLCGVRQSYNLIIFLRLHLYALYRSPRVEMNSQASGLVRTVSPLESPFSGIRNEVGYQPETTKNVAG